MLGVKSIVFIACALSVCYFKQASAQIDLSIYKTEDEMNEAINYFVQAYYGSSYTMFKDVDDTPISEHVNFRCIHRENLQFEKVALSKSDMAAKLSANKKTFFFVHEWSYYWDEIVEPMRSALRFMDINACIVDWGKLAHYQYNISARIHAPKVGDYMASFINGLSDIGISPDLVSLAGLGMGAHIAGYAGHALNGMIPEIFGLDPEGPFFTFPIVQDESHRLSTEDAKYVQTIVTTEGNFGATIPLGHENFYPNGGVNPQPTCLETAADTGSTSADTLLCSHEYATALFQYSFDPMNLFRAWKCDSSEAFLAGKCSSNEDDLMGPYAAKIHGDFHLSTDSSPPYTLLDPKVFLRN